MNKKGIYGIKPIRFKNISPTGTGGPDWGFIEFNLSKLLSQNILFAAYYEAKTISEIAELIGVQESLVKEVVDYFEENGFMDIITRSATPMNNANNQSYLEYPDRDYSFVEGGGKGVDIYLTNIFITNFTKEIYEESHKIFSSYAEIVCEKYIPLLIKSLHTTYDSLLKTKIYIPENDLNFFLWTAVTFALCRKFTDKDKDEHLSKHFIKRLDGGENIVSATIENDFQLSFNTDLYETFLDLAFTIQPVAEYPLKIWRYNTYYDDRLDGWENIVVDGFQLLYDYLNDRLGNEPIKERKIQYLRDNGYLIKREGGDTDYVNMIVMKMTMDDFLNLLPPLPEKFIKINNDFDKEVLNLYKPQFPPHQQGLCEDMYKNSISTDDLITRVLEKLLKDGVLKPLTENQRKSVNMMMFVS